MLKHNKIKTVKMEQHFSFLYQHRAFVRRDEDVNAKIHALIQRLFKEVREFKLYVRDLFSRIMIFAESTNLTLHSRYGSRIDENGLEFKGLAKQKLDLWAQILQSAVKSMTSYESLSSNAIFLIRSLPTVGKQRGWLIPF